ncbi:MAG: prepilin peptidase [Magnetospirillum sp.]|nr:prepilin peptidase [Magnetospirillum sp.]
MQSETFIAIPGVLFVAALVDAGVSDLRGFRIPDRAPLLLLAGFGPAAWALGMPITEALWSLGCAVAVFAGAVALFAAKMWGGGDAKLLPAVALWTGLAGLPRLLVVIALAGGALALVVLLARRAGVAKFADGHVPYGIAIAAGGFDWWAVAVLPRLIG